MDGLQSGPFFCLDSYSSIYLIEKKEKILRLLSSFRNENGKYRKTIVRLFVFFSWRFSLFLISVDI